MALVWLPLLLLAHPMSGLRMARLQKQIALGCGCAHPCPKHHACEPPSEGPL